MDKKKLWIIIVAVIAVIVVVVAVILAVNSSKEEKYTEAVVTEVVTDENGETVTDENGEPVTIVATEEVTDENGETVTNSDGKPVTEAVTTKVQINNNNNNAGNNNGGNNNANNNSNNNDSGSNNNSADNNNDNTDEVKPKSRKVTVDVVLPYYNRQETEITLSYKVDGDKEYTKLDPVKVKLDRSGKVETFDLGKHKGDIEVIVSFSGIKISENSIVIGAQEDFGEIKPVTGIEILEGEDD